MPARRMPTTLTPTTTLMPCWMTNGGMSLVGGRAAAQQRQPADAARTGGWRSCPTGRRCPPTTQWPASRAPLARMQRLPTPAVVGDVAVGHEEVVAADPRHPRVGGAAVDGDVLAEDVAVADLHAGRLVVVLEVLRPFAEDGAAEDLVVAAHGQRADQVGVRPEHAARPDADPALDDDEGPDLHVVGELGLGGQSRRWGESAASVSWAWRPFPGEWRRPGRGPRPPVAGRATPRDSVVYPTRAAARQSSFAAARRAALTWPRQRMS